MNIIGIIPARMASSRFPGKPLARIIGIPMVGHVYLRSRMCRALSEVYLATCDKEIAEYIESIGGKAVMTSPAHQRASDRTAEAMLKIEKKTGKRIDIAVMIQGDEPMVYPQMIQEAVKPMLENSEIRVVNLMAALKSKEEQCDPNTIKVTVDLGNYALYFSREPIPSWKKGAKNLPMYKQVCIMPFRRDFLLKFSRLLPTPLEVAESIDMLRVIEHGDKVRMVLTRRKTSSVDTKGDLSRVDKLMRKDKLAAKYMKSQGIDSRLKGAK